MVDDLVVMIRALQGKFRSQLVIAKNMQGAYRQCPCLTARQEYLSLEFTTPELTESTFSRSMDNMLSRINSDWQNGRADLFVERTPS